MAEIDNLMNHHGLDSTDLVSQIHSVIIGRRLSIPQSLRYEILDALSECDVGLQSSTYPRIHFERFLHRTAIAGKDHGLSMNCGGAAGFEPAVPGGGRCIIRAMLHARSREHALLKKSAPKKSNHRRAIRCHEAGGLLGVLNDNMSDLPNPYGEDDLPGSSESALERRVRIRDSQRVFWTKIATIRWSGIVRISISFAAVLATTLLASGRGGELVNIGVALFATQAILFFPAIRLFLRPDVTRDRLQLKIGRTRSMEAYPGGENLKHAPENTQREN